MYTLYITSFACILLQQKEASVLWNAALVYPAGTTVHVQTIGMLIDC